jgi:Flp pilus assembly protein TadD
MTGRDEATGRTGASAGPDAVRLAAADLLDRGDVAGAVELLDAEAQHIGPVSETTLAFYNNYANALRLAGRLTDSEVLLLELVRESPRTWQPWHNLGQTLRDQHRYEAAEDAMRHAMELAPEFGPNHGVLGEILLRLGRLDEALAELGICVGGGWDDDPAVWTAIGTCHRLLGRSELALEPLRRSLAVGGPSPTGHTNLGLALCDLGRFDEAIDQLDTACALDPSDGRVRAHRAYVRLAAGHLPDAWDDWEDAFVPGMRGPRREDVAPAWTPDQPAARVLVQREQGLGDEILLATCIPDLAEVAHHVILECDPRLAELFTRSFPRVAIRPAVDRTADVPPAADYDRVISAGSLPRHLRRSIDDFPARRVHLRADERRIARWRGRLEAAGPGPYVGISWRGRLMTPERRREYTSLDEWGRLFAVPGITWVTLQYGNCESELRAAEREFGVRLHRWDSLDLMNDLDEVAALMSNLDLVVAPRNAVAMLGGALGVETITLAGPHTWSELGTERLPWFGSVRTFHRDPTAGWAPALAAAADALVERTTC